MNTFPCRRQFACFSFELRRTRQLAWLMAKIGIKAVFWVSIRFVRGHCQEGSSRCFRLFLLLLLFPATPLLIRILILLLHLLLPLLKLLLPSSSSSSLILLDHSPSLPHSLRLFPLRLLPYSYSFYSSLHYTTTPPTTAISSTITPTPPSTTTPLPTSPSTSINPTTPTTYTAHTIPPSRLHVVFVLLFPLLILFPSYYSLTPSLLLLLPTSWSSSSFILYYCSYCYSSYLHLFPLVLLHVTTLIPITFHTLSHSHPPSKQHIPNPTPTCSTLSTPPISSPSLGLPTDRATTYTAAAAAPPTTPSPSQFAWKCFARLTHFSQQVCQHGCVYVLLTSFSVTIIAGPVTRVETKPISIRLTCRWRTSLRAMRQKDST